MENAVIAGSAQQMGFVYHVEHYRNGALLEVSETHNLIPTEGLNHALGVMLKGDTQQTSWYVAIYEGNYTPIAGATASNITTAATECVAYAEATRQQWVGGTVANGFVSNTDSRAVFTMNATKKVYGGFLVSSPVKGSSTGVLVSVVRFATAKDVETGDILRVRAEFTNVSAA